MKASKTKFVDAVTEIVTVTPEIALDWLTKNTKNRPIRRKWVTDLSDRIKRGEWHMNGESIKFAKDGTLLDGQHRLEAILDSEKSIDILVVRGLPPESYETMDTGKSRTTSDYLAVEGEKYYSQLASGLRFFAYLQGMVAWNNSISNAQADSYLEKNPNIRESVPPSLRVRNIMHPGLAIALHYLFSCQDSEKAEWFFDHIASGTDLSRSHPVLQLRQRLLERPKGYHLAPMMMAALTIKAWNAYTQGASLLNLRWRQSGDSPEPFPEIGQPAESKKTIKKRKAAQ